MKSSPAAVAGEALRLASGGGVRVPAAILLLLVAAALLGPLLSPHDYFTMDLSGRLQPPALEGARLFGTDDLGRDLFVRSMSGARVTLLVAVVASLVSLVIGVTYGALAGYAGGRIDAFMMRMVDALYALPFMFLVILLMVAVFLALQGMPALTAEDEEISGGEGFFAYVWPLVVGTVVASVIAMVVATPVAVGIALFVSHYAPRRIGTAIGFVSSSRSIN